MCESGNPCAANKRAARRASGRGEAPRGGKRRARGKGPRVASAEEDAGERRRGQGSIYRVFGTWGDSSKGQEFCGLWVRLAAACVMERPGAGWRAGERIGRRGERVSSGIGGVRDKVGEARLARQGRETVDGASGTRRSAKRRGTLRALGSSGFPWSRVRAQPAEPSSLILHRNYSLSAVSTPPCPHPAPAPAIVRPIAVRLLSNSCPIRCPILRSSCPVFRSPVRRKRSV